MRIPVAQITWSRRRIGLTVVGVLLVFCTVFVWREVELTYWIMSIRLAESQDETPVIAPGRSRVVFHYINRPNLKWQGDPLVPDNPTAMRCVRNSTACSVTSNAVIFTVGAQ